MRQQFHSAARLWKKLLLKWLPEATYPLSKQHELGIPCKQPGRGANISSVFEIGRTGYFAVSGASPRSVDHDWARVKLLRGKRAEGSEAPSRLLQSGEWLICKVDIARSRCIEAWSVAHLRSIEGKNSRGSRICSSDDWSQEVEVSGVDVAPQLCCPCAGTTCGNALALIRAGS